MDITGYVLIFCNSVAIYLLRSFIHEFIRSENKNIAALVFAIMFGIMIIVTIPMTIRYFIKRIRNKKIKTEA